MIEASSFLDAAGRAGIGFYAGVPCSFLTPLINRTASDRALRYVGAASEGEAVAIAAGAWLAGRETAVMCQNSGLGNAVNPLTSLNAPFRIPTLLIVTWRGQPGLKDEPQHELMGRITQSLLDVIEVPHRPFPDRADLLGPALDEAREMMARTSRPFALVMEKDSLREELLDEAPRTRPEPGRHIDLGEGGDRPSRVALLERVLAAAPEDVPIIVTTGKAGRELFTLADREQHLYQVGSMGCASPMGLGVALTTGRRTVVLDGDGAALMKLGAFATIGAYQPPGLLHVLLDNGVHDFDRRAGDRVSRDRLRRGGCGVRLRGGDHLRQRGGLCRRLRARSRHARAGAAARPDPAGFAGKARPSHNRAARSGPAVPRISRPVRSVRALKAMNRHEFPDRGQCAGDVGRADRADAADAKARLLRSACRDRRRCRALCR